LGGGAAMHLPSRQQTLRGAIGWSYTLLEPAEQRLFTRLAVFAGGCSGDAAVAVTMDEGTAPPPTPPKSKPQNPKFAILAGLGSLVSKSLLQQRQGVGNTPRFVMLETIREY